MLYIRFDKAKPKKTSTKFWYAKLFRNDKNIRQQYYGSLGKIRVKNNHVQPESKINFLIRLIVRVATLNVPMFEKRAILSNKNYRFTEKQKVKYGRQFDFFNNVKDLIIGGYEYGKNKKLYYEYNLPKPKFNIDEENFFKIVDSYTQTLELINGIDLNKVDERLYNFFIGQYNRVEMDGFIKELKKKLAESKKE